MDPSADRVRPRFLRKVHSIRQFLTRLCGRWHRLRRASPRRPPRRGDAPMMMIAALVALGCGAVAGITLATRHFLRKRLPVWIALLHGLGGATGFTLVLLTVVREPSFRPIREVLYLLIATVAFGVVNL